MLHSSHHLAMQPRVAALTAYVVVVAIGAGLVLAPRPPRPLSAAAPASAFSAARAMAHVSALAHEPRPMGSAAHDRARDYIVSRIRAAGAAPQVQRAIGAEPAYHSAGRVENVLARLEGRGNRDDALLLMAHYDSVIPSTGAGDNASGVAALLETLRALGAGPPLTNDVIVLFTDGEEAGLLGAAAFAAEHPWARDVRLAINFDSKGNAGLVGNFETSEQNGVLVETLARVDPGTYSTSLFYEIFKRLPNDTDLTVLKRAGAAAMNFGMAGHFEVYHTRLDTAAKLDHGSLQQLGEVALGLARAFGEADLQHLRAPDRVFFSVPFVGLARYPVWGNWVLLVAAVPGWVAAARALFRGAQATTRGVVLAAVIWVVLLGATTALAFGLMAAVSRIHAGPLPAGPVYISAEYFAGLLLLLATGWTASVAIVGRWQSDGSLTLGAGLVLLIIGAALAWWLPGTAYLAVWPALAVVCAILVTGAVPPVAGPSWAPVIFALPPLVVLGPVLTAFVDAVGLVDGAPMIGAAMALLLLGLTPAIASVLRIDTRYPLALTATAALTFVAAGAASTSYSESHPKASTLFYALDADSGQAVWATADPPDAWSSQLLGPEPRQGPLPFAYSGFSAGTFAQAAAPVASLDGPRTEVIADRRDGVSRKLSLRLAGPPGATALCLLVPLDAVTSVELEGRRLADTSGVAWRPNTWEVVVYNPLPEGVSITLTVTHEPLPIDVIAIVPGLPADAGPPPRPPDQMEQHTGDRTIVRRHVER